MNKTDTTIVSVLVLAFLTCLVLMAIHDNGQKKVIQMQQVIEISGAASDTEVEEVGALFGVRPTLERDYGFWELIRIGSKDDPSPVKIANVIAEINVKK